MEIQSHKNKMVVFAAIIMSILLFALDNMIITPAMPRILLDIGGLSYLNWVFTAYMLTSTITTPIYGRLLDIFSRRTMFLFAVGLFVVSSMLCGLSTNIYELIFFRAIQGIGGGAIMVASVSMIGELFSLKERAKYQGFIGMVFAIASISGPMLGAVITDSFSWRWTFYINFPIGLIAFIILYRYLPRTLHQRKDHRIDYLGAFLLTSCLTPMLLMFSAISANNSISPLVIFLFTLSVVSFIAFYYTEKRVPSPVFSHHLFHDRHFVVPAIMTFINAIVMFASTLYIQLYAQKVLNLPIKEAGLIMSAIVIPLTLSSPLYGQIVSRTGKYKKVVIFGSIVLFLSVLDFAYVLQTGLTKWTLVFHLIPLGIGLGAMMSIFNMIIQMVYPRERMGEVTGAIQLVRGVGGSFGTAFLGFVFVYFVKDINVDGQNIAHALAVIFEFLTVLCFISLVAAFNLKEQEETK